MKKYIITITICVILLLCLLLIPGKSDKQKYVNITLAEVTHSPFYTPLYIAINQGYFEEEGIKINLILTSGADKVSTAILSDDAQIGLAGAESALYIYEKNKKDPLKIISGLTQKDGQFLISRTKDFTLKDLYGKEILVGRKTGMPALNFINALEKNNIDTTKIKINYDVDFASLTGSFIGKNGDFVNLFEPNATQIENNKQGYVVQSIGELSGNMPYTVFYAKDTFIKNNKKTIQKFNKAINKAIKYTYNNSEKEIAKIIAPSFEGIKRSDLTKIVKRYKEINVWQKETTIPKEHLNNLEDLLVKNDLLKKKISYNKIIYHE